MHSQIIHILCSEVPTPTAITHSQETWWGCALSQPMTRPLCSTMHSVNQSQLPGDFQFTPIHPNTSCLYSTTLPMWPDQLGPKLLRQTSRQSRYQAIQWPSLRNQPLSWSSMTQIWSTSITTQTPGRVVISQYTNITDRQTHTHTGSPDHQIDGKDHPGSRASVACQESLCKIQASLCLSLFHSKLAICVVSVLPCVDPSDIPSEAAGQAVVCTAFLLTPLQQGWGSRVKRETLSLLICHSWHSDWTNHQRDWKKELFVVARLLRAAGLRPVTWWGLGLAGLRAATTMTTTTTTTTTTKTLQMRRTANSCYCAVCSQDALLLPSVRAQSGPLSKQQRKALH